MTAESADDQRERAKARRRLPGAGLGIQRGLVKKCTQSSFGTIGAASLKMKRKIATMPMIELQPQTRMSHSIGFSRASKG